ncbi:MAG: DUF547 domain-containing protein [Methylococcaceae bacterium]|jgi:hypothetical protein
MLSLKFCLISSLLMFSLTVSAREPDWATYSAVLKNIQAGTKNNVDLALVDYPALIQSGKLQQAYVELTKFPLKNLSGKTEQLAFYINAYNILALKTVADHWPLKSIKEVGNLISPVWGKPAGSLDGTVYSLDDIENKILRPMAEPRIHFAIVCASVSCPDLRNSPFTATELEGQLDDQAQKFLNNSSKGLNISAEKLNISQIFQWFPEDFESKGGVGHFLRHYRADIPKNLPIDYLEYDWDVNGNSPIN